VPLVTFVFGVVGYGAKPAPTTDPNLPPPAGAILDLNGTPIPGGGNNTFQQYTVNFVAGLANTAITFAFRDDPAFLSFEQASVTDLTHPSGNLLTNGALSGGTYTNNGDSLTPIGWTYANLGGGGAGGVRGGCGGPSGFCWFDGIVGGYDTISQTIPTNIGDTYQISFFLAENSGCSCNFTSVSTTGPSGIDVLAYAQGNLPAPTTPAPGTLTLLGIGLTVVVGWTFRTRIHEALFARTQSR
jgi:hypothetical protein